MITKAIPALEDDHLLKSFILSLPVSLMAVAIGFISDRFNRRLILIACCAVSGLALASIGLATQLWHLYLLRLVAGTCQHGCIPPAISIIVDQQDEKLRIGAVGI
jgi:MFS family permease